LKFQTVLQQPLFHRKSEPVSLGRYHGFAQGQDLWGGVGVFGFGDAAFLDISRTVVWRTVFERVAHAGEFDAEWTEQFLFGGGTGDLRDRTQGCASVAKDAGGEGNSIGGDLPVFAK
jgi:hypothetical protein